MLRTLWKEILADPGPQPADAYQLGFVRVCAWLALVGSLTMMVMAVAFGQPERLPTMASYVVVGAVGLLLLRAGRERIALLWVVWGIWLACTYTMFRIGGVLNVSVSGSYAIVVLGAGWLLGTRQAVLITAATLFALGVATYGMVSGWEFIRDVRAPPVLAFTALVLLVLAAGTLGYFAARSIRARVEALQRSQGRFEALFRQGPVASAIAEQDTGVLLDCNQAYLDLLGYRREDMIGKSGLDLGLWVHAADRTRAFGILRDDGVVRGVETRWRTASGGEICIVLNMLAVDMDGKRRFVSQSVDITALKEAEAALRESEARFVQAFRSSPQALVIVRLSDGRMVETNDAFEQLTGYSRAEAMERTSIELGLWQDTTAREQLFRELSAGVTVMNRAVRCRDRQGNPLDLRLTSTLIHMGGDPYIYASMIDVTHEVLAQQALEVRERELASANRELKLQLALHELTEQVAKVGHWITNVDEDRVVWSAALADIGGVPPQAPMTIEKSRSIVTMEPVDRMAGLRERLDGRPEVFHFKRADGGERWVRILIVRPPGEDAPSANRYFGVVQDITEEHAAKLALEQLNAELEGRVAARTAELRTAIEELDAFSYTVAHDLNAPLRSIHGFSSLLEEDAAGRLTDEEKRHLKRIRDATTRMGDLIADLLLLSRVTRTEMRHERVDLSAMARAISTELSSQDPHRTVTWRIAQGVTVQGDRGLLQVALENLLGNAWKYSRNRSDALIEFGRLSALGQVKSSVFFVRDNGAGFDDANASGLFKPFTRLHSEEEFEGTGVGLATVHRVIRRHGGAVWAEASPGRGATFYFTMPGVHTA